MASGDFDTPQIALLVGMPDAASKSGNLFSHSSPLFDSSLLPTSPSPSYIHGSPCPPTPSPTPMLRSAQCSLGSIRWATSTALCDHNLEERVGSPSYLSQNLQDGPRDRRRRTGNSTERKTERATGYDRSLSRAAPPDWTATLTRTVHVASQDSGTGAGSRRPSFVTSFFRRTVRRVRRPSLESDTGSEKGSDTAQNGGQKGFNVNQSIVDNLEERLEATKKLHREAVDLQMFYESGTFATMRDLRATVLPRPLPQDNAVFNEVNFFLAEIGRYYEELNKFWKEEIRHVAKALKEGRTDPRDFERWNNFHSNLRQTIEFWKKRPPESLSDAQILRSNNTPSSTEVDLGAIAASLSSTMGSLEDALERMSSSTSLRYSQLGRSSFQRVYVAFAGNSDICLSFLRDCADFGERVLAWRLASIGLPTSSRAGALHDLRERSTGLRSEVTGVSVRILESLENGVGGGGALLRRRTHPTQGLSTGTPPIYHASLAPDATLQSFTVSHAADNNPPTPDIMITSPVSEPIEDKERILGQNILPQYPSQILLQLRWLTLKDKVLVLLSIYAIVSLSLNLFN